MATDEDAKASALDALLGFRNSQQNSPPRRLQLVHEAILRLNNSWRCVQNETTKDQNVGDYPKIFLLTTNREKSCAQLPTVLVAPITRSWVKFHDNANKATVWPRFLLDSNVMPETEGQKLRMTHNYLFTVRKIRENNENPWIRQGNLRCIDWAINNVVANEPCVVSHHWDGWSVKPSRQILLPNQFATIFKKLCCAVRVHRL